MKRPTFPDYAALVNPVAGNAFAMREICRLDVDEERTIRLSKKGETHTVFSREFNDFAVCDTGLLIAPFVEFSGPNRELTHQVGVAEMALKLDDQVLFRRRPLFELRRDADGQISEEPWCDFHAAAKRFFWAEALQSGTGEATGKPDNAIGLMLPNGSKVEATVTGLPLSGDEIWIRTGLIMAHYSTRVPSGKA